MEIGWLVAIIAPAISALGAAVAKWLTDRRISEAPATRVTVHDSDGREVVVDVEGRTADDVASALQEALNVDRENPRR